MAVLLVSGGIVVAAAPAATAAPCDPGNSPIVCENSKPGDTGWEVSGQGSATIEGFATAMSVNAGQTESFKIRTMSLDDSAVQTQTPYAIDIYRLGWYGGAGGRKVGSVTPTLHMQPDCLNDTTTGLVDCGNWAVSASWTVPADAVSGVYVAHLQRSDVDKDNQVVFVVRNDSSHSTMVYQTSDTTWQAYNTWGGNSLYLGQPAGRAYKVSYNRPFATRMVVPDGRDFIYGSEYPMIRFLERNGYDVSYISGIDTDRSGSLLLNHKTFLSVGHDEYWSKNQRANVTAARDAGVNLAFFSGNEVFWKTRWEASQDGTNTPYRTLVTYKETHANAKIDPSPEWTGTWRDPRFSPPADGNNPENSLTGNIWTVNCCSYAIQVPAADGKMRFWRNTSVATQASGAVATLADNTLGYEWDEDLDNGARPPGLIRMSTTTEDVAARVTDYGSTVAPGTATHHLTMYKAASGALVFGAGTVQWSWGLDPEHDGAAVAADPRIQQATVNILADMSAQPATLMSGLVAATASTDTTPPTTTITSPAPGVSVRSGASITVTGTASDVGGRVGGVEVSLDNGATWHPADGRESWTYTGSVPNKGSVTIKARAADDSANLQSTPAAVTITGTCPCTLFGDTQVPATPSTNDARAINVATRFTTDTAGFITGMRFYKGAGNTGTHVGALWDSTGRQLAQTTFTDETGSGWQTASFVPAVAVQTGATYLVSYNAPNGHWAGDEAFFARTASDRAPLHGPITTGTAPNGLFDYGSTLAFPTRTFNGANYWVDPVFDTVAPPDTIPPHAAPLAPIDGSSSVSRTAAVSASFDESIQAASVAFTVKDPAGNAAPGTVTYTDSTKTASFTPTGTLAASTKYTASVSGAKDLAGNVMTAPITWSFTTQKPPAQPGVCPCSLWDDTATPTVVTVNDPKAVELGVRFTPDVDGTITGVRFYKGPQNTGTHLGSLWSTANTATPIATATFSNETTAGWQQVSFATPVTVTAGTTYVASYHTDTGFYSATNGGLNAAKDSPPLHAPANSLANPNGIYRYGATGFPTTGNGANYWVDAVFQPAPDTAAPTVTAVSPGNGARSVNVSGPVAATFNEAIDPSTVSIKVSAGGAAPAAGTTTYDATSRTATFRPSAALAAATDYTVAVTAADPSGNAMTAPATSHFTTSGLAACPCTIFGDSAKPVTAASTDTKSVEIGVKFKADANGWIAGVRFYKGAGNTGTHTGSLWSSTGQQLATGTFANETATGWQQLTFDNPVAITAGTVYVASYHAPAGRYAADSGYFANAEDNAPLHALANGTSGVNGVFTYAATTVFPQNGFQSSNYWVDAVYTTTRPNDVTPPAVQSGSPADGATTVPSTATVSATFTEDVTPTSPRITLTPAGGAAVAGTMSYVAATRTATFTPTTALDASTVYTASVTGAQDPAGNTMTAPATWSFTTAASPTGSCPCTLFPDSSVPQTTATTDAQSVEVGVRFSSDTDGFITGVRFYKGTPNTGVHFGHLWSTTGTLLASGRFAGESSSGWQTLTFAKPVAVTAGTTYIASYFAPVGRYAATSHGFQTAGVDRAPLHAPKAAAGAANGVFLYGAAPAFPTNGNDSNYWVDVVYAPTAPAPDTTAPTAAAVTPADASTGAAIGTTITAAFTEPVTSASVQFTVTGPGGGAVAGTLAYNPATLTATFTPASAVAHGTLYTAQVTASDGSGNAMAAPAVWSFTTG